MGTLKKLIGLNESSGEERKSSEPKNEDGSQMGLTFFQSGYAEAKNANGNPTIFLSCLEAVYQDFKEKCRKNDEEQRKLTSPYQDEANRLNSEIQVKKTAKEIAEEQITDKEEQISKINNDISQVKANPEKFGIDADKKPKAQFYIGLALLLPITLYLIVFYMSASYSAFFKVFDNQERLAALFDGNAFMKALNDGVLEAVFVGTIPFVFMGLGYLIHMFMKEKNKAYLKIVALFIVALIFDGILAYLIEEKIYNYGKTLLSEPFDLPIALKSVEFWGIIFAGFVVYVIWGLVLDFVMKEHENIDKINLFIESMKDKRQVLESELKGHNEQVRKLQEIIIQLEGKLNEVQSKLNGFIFPNRKYLVYHTEYAKGWFLAISKEIALPTKEKNRMIEECRDISIQHLNNYGVNNEDAENTIYAKTIA